MSCRAQKMFFDTFFKDFTLPDVPTLDLQEIQSPLKYVVAKRKGRALSV